MMKRNYHVIRITYTDGVKHQRLFSEKATAILWMHGRKAIAHSGETVVYCGTYSAIIPRRNMRRNEYISRAAAKARLRGTG